MEGESNQLDRIKNAPTITPTFSNALEEWFIIAGGHSTTADANVALDKALTVNANSNVIKKGNSYRTVLMGYSSKIEAENDLQIVKINLISTAYVVRKSTWCTTIEQSEECVVCK